MPPIQLESVAEDALLLRFGDSVDIAVNARVHAAVRRLRRRWPTLEYVPAYSSLLLRFDPQLWAQEDGHGAHRRLGDAVLLALADLPVDGGATRLVEIPVHYGDESGPDLAEVSAITGLSIEAVIARHTAPEYRVAMLGFAPGFPYLLGLDPQLAMPRRPEPRQRVPAGSVAIGGGQTGIYPDALPGGWHLIGRTPLRLFDAKATAPSLLAAGDRVCFRSVRAEALRRPVDSPR